MTATAPARPLRVLHLEDSEPDHELAMAYLRRAGLDVQTRRVEDASGFEQALGEPWDAILSDYYLPCFSGLDALGMLQASPSTLPFIIVSGAIGEDMAVEAMKRGASDYLLKDNLNRLAPALLKAIEANESRRAKLQADAELARSRERLSKLAQHLQASVEQERASIAREIHDDVGGSLAALKFDLAWIDRHAGDLELQARVRSALETLDHAIEASQRVMHNLRPAMLEQGLVAALQWMTAQFQKRTGVACRFRTSHDAMQLPSGVPLVAYRTVQEALTNVGKHARATRVSLELQVAGGVLTIEIADNGIGLTADDLAKARSFGIRGLHERADTVGGWIDLVSNAAGTTLILSVPLTAPDPGRAGTRGAAFTEDGTDWGAP